MNKISVLALSIIISINCLVVNADNGPFKKKFEEAEILFSSENYLAALPIYLELANMEPDNANIAYKIGLCYFNSPLEKNKAETYFLKPVNKTSKNYKDGEYKEKDAPEISYKYLAQAYHYNYKFDEALETYEKYRPLINSSDIASLSEFIWLVEMSKYAKEAVKTPVNFTITNLGGKINSPFPDYAPVISADESTIIFTSRKNTTTGGEKDEFGQFFEDIYVSNKVDNEWSQPVDIGASINTAGNDATIGISVDGQQLFIYKDDNGDGNIYSSRLQGETWSVPAKLGSNINSKAWEPSASLSADGNTLFFVSDRKGGFGGRDIYFCSKLPNGEWSLAKNLGPSINTPKDEDSPFIHPDGQRLYFSSNGHKTMGGFDIFLSNINENGQWSQPENLGYPINTTDDDIFYVPTADGKGAYYSSFREGGYGEKDLYYMHVPEQKEAGLTVFRGTILDQYGGVPENLNITVTDNITGDIVGTYAPNVKTGKYLFILPPGGNYNITYEAEGYLFHSENIEVSQESAYQIINRPIELTDLKVGNKVVLKNIFFESGKATLMPESKTELEKLKQILLKNPKLTIEIGGHTDSKGRDEFNMKLSQDRANAVANELINSGIDSRRIKAVGYGETMPIAINTNPDGSDNKEGMAINRRFEFKILSLDGSNIEVEEPVKVPEELKKKKEK